MTETPIERMTARTADAKSITDARRISAKMHPSRKWEPLKMLEINTAAPDHTFEYWQNALYSVNVRRFYNGSKMKPLNDRSEWTYLGICCEDGSARHDWRDMQKIKNEIVGKDWEAVELFPSEARLVDPSNYFILWAFPSIPIGMFDGRKILCPKSCVVPQRGWSKGDEPPDIGKSK